MDIQELNKRSREIFRIIVETYLDSGEPIGSRTISRVSGIDLSSASVRNVMADLEEFGLLASPHTSAGRLPTEAGLRLFVDGLLEIGDLTSDQRSEIESHCAGSGRGVEEVLAEATQMLSGLSHCASLVMAPKQNAPLKQIEFVYLQPGRGLVVLVFENGSVENRVIDLPPGLPPTGLVRATNYLNARLAGRTFEEMSRQVEQELKERQAELDSLTAEVVASGLATWAGGEEAASSLIVRGRANLLEDEGGIENLERIRQLFDDLESKQDLLRLLDGAREGSGVKIFIGAETNLFSLSGSSVIVSPYMNGAGEIVGVVGVIGPTRLNYARIIPMVDYTARVIGKIL
jgi:heat-inducible transcriptional repressor